MSYLTRHACAADGIALEDPSIEDLPLKRGGWNSVADPNGVAVVQASKILSNAQTLESKRIELQKLRCETTLHYHLCFVFGKSLDLQVLFRAI